MTASGETARGLAAVRLILRAVVGGTMAVAARTVHLRNGYYIVDEGYEYVLALSAATKASAEGPELTAVSGDGKRPARGQPLAAKPASTFIARPVT